jgi:hypothetical protein
LGLSMRGRVIFSLALLLSCCRRSIPSRYILARVSAEENQRRLI